MIANLNTPSEVLARLARDENVYVRITIAGNTNITPEILAQLAKDENSNVKEVIAINTLARWLQLCCNCLFYYASHI
jgi:hypothetical protein